MTSNIWIRYFHLNIGMSKRWAKTPICVLKFFFENVQFCLRVFSRDPLNLRCRKLRVRDTRKKATFLALFRRSFVTHRFEISSEITENNTLSRYSTAGTFLKIKRSRIGQPNIKFFRLLFFFRCIVRQRK